MISIDDILDELPEGKLLLTIIDADGVVQASGIGIWPPELPGCCRTPEVVPGFLDFEVTVPRSMPAGW